MIDFRKIEIENIDGSIEAADLSKTLGNAMYVHCQTHEAWELSRKIWKDGEVELSAEEKQILHKMIPVVIPSYVLRTALLNAINK